MSGQFAPNIVKRLFGDSVLRLLKHPGALFSLAYLIWALLGVCYLVMFYREFNIDILKFIEISDLLIAGLQDPKVSLAFLGACLVILIIVLMSHWSETKLNQRIDKLPSWTKSLLRMLFYVPRSNSILRVTFLGSLILYFIVFLKLSIDTEVSNIKSGNAPALWIYTDSQALRPECDSGTADNWRLLGTTTKFAFFYSNDCHMAHVLTVENIQQIVKPALTQP
ncbi:MAG: hypothetical protein HWE13_04745 [Gammaproteobacteria bacterium]|nr:hypothetical protein [Gammaproteobacteria bacterium]NVK87407.1 hypothetical protein [Gammaproteobacteria bacterium]